MKIRVVKSGVTCWHHGGMAAGSFYKDDTVEIDFDKIVYFMADNGISPENIESGHDVRRIIESFLHSSIDKGEK